MKTIVKSLSTVNYHKELIEMLLRVKSGAIVVGLFGPLFYFYIFRDAIPSMILLFWIIAQLFILTFRMILNQKILNNIDLYDSKTLNINLKKYLLFIYANSFLWGLSSVFALVYGNENQVYILIAAIFGILAGSISTLTPIYHAIFVFMFNIIFIFILSLVFIGGTTQYYITAILLGIYMIVSIPASFRMFSALQDSIFQREKITALNNSLEIRVKEAILETKQKEKMLQEQSRLAQMGEMISMIAHQWRQPLSAISSSILSIQARLSIGKYDLSVPDDRDKFLKFLDQKHKNINDYVQTLSETIDDFRNFFKPDKDKEKVVLSEPVNKALQIVKTSMSSKGIDICCDFVTEDELFIYQNELMQVVLNILKNSEDNFREKATVDPKINIAISKEDDYEVIKISDNGGGISEDIISNIFDPYFSTKDEKNGTGLGLYMSKIMIEDHHNGKLSVSNTKDGVCFKILLSSSYE